MNPDYLSAHPATFSQTQSIVMAVSIGGICLVAVGLLVWGLITLFGSRRGEVSMSVFTNDRPKPKARP